MRRCCRLLALTVLSCSLAAPTVASTAGQVTLARKGDPSTRKDESYPGVVVRYEAIRDAKGQRLRLIVTYPKAGGPEASGCSHHPTSHALRCAPPSGPRFPTIFVTGWLSCDSVEAPPGTQDPTQKVFQAIAQLPGFATVRLDKPGVGDSDGDCSATDFVTELEGYRRGFRWLQDAPFVDRERLFLFGISNGGGFAPLVAEGTPVRGYVVDGGWIKTWYEHMLEIERRRLTLAGKDAAEINSLMKWEARLYSAYLLDRQAPADILARHPQMKSLWEGGPEHQYGRPVAYYQQLQDLNLMAAWSQVKVPVLALHGEFDWIMSRDDFQILVSLVNRNTPGAAALIELPATGHTFEHYSSQQAAFTGEQSPFDPAVAARVTDWFQVHR